MSILNIPAYFYFGAGSDQVTKQMNISFATDDGAIAYFRGKYGNNANNRQLINSTGLNETNILSYINQHLSIEYAGQNNTPLFARNLELYGHYQSAGQIPTEMSKALGLSGFNCTPVYETRNFTKVVTLNSFEPYLGTGADFIGNITSSIGVFDNACVRGDTGQGPNLSVTLHSTYANIDIVYPIYPSGIFTPDGINTEFEESKRPIYFYILCKTNNTFDAVTEITVSLYTYDGGVYLTSLQSVFTRDGVEFSTQYSGINEQDTQNPYAYDGNSGIGGGDGKYNLDSDGLTEVPDLPDIDAADLGFVTMYNPTKAQLKDLAAFMWSNAFDLVTYKKLFSDPMESIIGLAIVPVTPSVGGSKNVTFGSIDSGVNMNYLASQYVTVDCGSVDIDKYVGSFLDYDYTKISIYLPYIGFRQLDADDVMGRTISVDYNVDCLSGACAAFISVSGRGVMYSYNGSCISNIPLTAANFSGAIQNAISAIISGAGVVAGAATGAAPLTAMGAAGLLNSAANTALNSKPAIQRSGNLGGSAGILSVQHPFVIISRPDVSVPSSIQNYVGQCSNITMNLADCSGFTMIDYIHLHDVDASADELTEIENLLKGGVIL